MKRNLFSLLGVVAVGCVLAVTASASAPRTASIVIRHQTQHCHAWSLNNGSYTAAVSAKLAKGGAITFTNNDIMSHTLILKSGPKITLLGKALLNHIGARVTVRFPTAGVYVLGTKTGDDYMKNVKTIGADNILRLTVTVH